MTDWHGFQRSFAAGRLMIDPADTFQLLSGITVTNASYTGQYVYNGVHLHLHQHAGFGSQFDFRHQRFRPSINSSLRSLPSLPQVDAVQYNQLNQVATTTKTATHCHHLDLRPDGPARAPAIQQWGVVTYGYDVLGNRTNLTDYTGTTFYSWDALNRLTNVITSRSGVKGGSDNLSLSYEYDLADMKPPWLSRRRTHPIHLRQRRPPQHRQQRHEACFSNTPSTQLPAS